MAFPSAFGERGGVGVRAPGLAILGQKQLSNCNRQVTAFTTEFIGIVEL